MHTDIASLHAVVSRQLGKLQLILIYNVCPAWLVGLSIDSYMMPRSFLIILDSLVSREGSSSFSG